MLDEYKTFLEKSNFLSDAGIDVFDSKYAIAPHTEKLFDFIIKQNYEEFGIEWINWFVYDNNFGRSKLKAFDNDETPICQDYDGLYEYCKQYERQANNG